MNNDSLITEWSGLFILNLKPCTCGILSFILNPEVEFVWIRRHIPEPYIRWTRTPVVLSPKHRLHEVEIRFLEFDLQLSTQRFMDLLTEFEDHGIELFQMRSRVPDTLHLHKVSENAAASILIQNGLHVAFYLPHSHEYAQLRAPDRTTLERLLTIPQIKELAYAAEPPPNTP